MCSVKPSKTKNGERKKQLGIAADRRRALIISESRKKGKRFVPDDTSLSPSISKAVGSWCAAAGEHFGTAHDDNRLRYFTLLVYRPVKAGRKLGGRGEMGSLRMSGLLGRLFKSLVVTRLGLEAVVGAEVFDDLDAVDVLARRAVGDGADVEEEDERGEESEEDEEAGDDLQLLAPSVERVEVDVGKECEGEELKNKIKILLFNA